MDNLLYGIMVTFLGMAIVFASLWALNLLLIGFKVTFYKEKKAEVQKSVLPAEVVAAKEEEETESNDEELVAVIAAAIAAHLGTRVDNLIVRSIHRVPQSTPSWGRVGIENQMTTRL